MKTCAVPACKSGYPSNKVKEKLSWHRFPKDTARRSQWVDIPKRLNAERGRNFSPSQYSVVCSKHFEPCFYTVSGKLSFDAFPTLLLEDSGADHLLKTPDNTHGREETSPLQVRVNTMSNTEHDVRDRTSNNTEHDVMDRTINNMEHDVRDQCTSPVMNTSDENVAPLEYSLQSPHSDDEVYDTPTNTSNQSAAVASATPPRRKHKLYLSEMSPSDFSSPRRARYNLALANNQMSKCQKTSNNPAKIEQSYKENRGYEVNVERFEGETLFK